MPDRRYLARLVLLAACCGVTSIAHAFSYEPPSRFLPGAYFEHKAQFYLRHKNYVAALEMFQLAGYWANKVAQYNVGVMYFNGIGGVPVDRVLGTAWLGIAAEQHHELADGALQSAYGKLSADQRVAAEGIFQQLDAKYGDKVALPRAVRHFDDERMHLTGSRVGMVGNMRIIDAENPMRMGNEYYAEQDQVFNSYISRFGSAAVGEVRELPIAEDAKAGAARRYSPKAAEAQEPKQ